MRIIHVIPNLNVGGAETMMKNLITEQENSGHNVTVIAFYQSDSSIRKALESIGIEIVFIDKKAGFDLSAIFKLIDLQYKCNTKKIMTQKATRDIMGVTTQP